MAPETSILMSLLHDLYQTKQGLIFNFNHLYVDESHEISSLILLANSERYIAKYVVFQGCDSGAY